MPTEKNNEINIVSSLLALEISNKPSAEFIKSFVTELASYPIPTQKAFRMHLSELLMQREADHKGHLKTQAIRDLLDFSRAEIWLIESGMSERAAHACIRPLQEKGLEKFLDWIHDGKYLDFMADQLTVILTKTGITEMDAKTFLRIIAEMELSAHDQLMRPFYLNFRADIATRRETFRKSMTLKEMVGVYLLTFLEVVLSEYGLDDRLIHEMAFRLSQCNNMKRQFLVAQQIERYLFSFPSDEETRMKPREFWLSLINEHDLKIALEQYLINEKVRNSTLEITDLYVEARNLFVDVRTLQDETLAVISITYRLDNPEEAGHTAEELLSMIDQTIVMTQELSPLPVNTRDIFSFFEIIGECDHRNRRFRQSIVQFRSRIRKLAESAEASGDRITLSQLVLTYLYSRLDAFLEDEGARQDIDESAVLESIRDRLTQCSNAERQFAIVDLIEKHLFENPGLLQIVDRNYWPELINTFELNIILEAYIDRKYIITEKRTSRFEILNSILSHINAIEPINVKSLTVVFLTAHLASHLEQSQQVTIDEIAETTAQFRKDAVMAAGQIDMQNQVKRKMLNTLTQRLFRLEALEKELSDENIDLLSRLDEVVVGLRTRRDNLIAGKMDPGILERDTEQFLSDPKVVELFEECERIFKDRLEEQAREKKMADNS